MHLKFWGQIVGLASFRLCQNQFDEIFGLGGCEWDMAVYSCGLKRVE